jgi:centromeric protein E
LHLQNAVQTANSWFLLNQASISDHHKSQAGDLSDDDCSVSDSSSVAGSYYPNGGARKFNNPHYYDGDSRSNPVDPSYQLRDNTEDHSLSDDTSSPLSIGKKFIRSDFIQSQEKTAVGTAEDPDDYCKEVRCIEMEESSKNKNSESHALRTGENEETLALSVSGDVSGQELMSTPVNGNREVSQIQNGLAYVALEQKLHNIKMTIDSIFSSYPDKPSPQAIAAGMTSARGLKLTRSWSCRANLMTGSSFPETGEQIESTPPNGLEKGFPGRPEEGLRRKFPLLTYGSNNTILSRNDSQSSSESASIDELRSQSIRTSAEEITGIHTFVAGLKEMAKLDYEKQLVDGQVRRFLFACILTFCC